MISFGDGWTWSSGLLSHSCAPDLSAACPGQRTSCECGAPVPRHARSFQRWIKRELRRSARDLDAGEGSPTTPRIDSQHKWQPRQGT